MVELGKAKRVKLKKIWLYVANYWNYSIVFLVSKILYTMKIEDNFLIYRIKSVIFNINLILKYDLGDNNVSL